MRVPSTLDDAAVVLAVKALDDAKSRLRPLPRAHDDRPTLVAAMLADTLDAVTAIGPRRVVVVSPDARVHEIAAGAGATAVDEPVDAPAGWTPLNAALARGAAATDASVIVYLQADLPALGPDSLRAALDAAASLDDAPAAFVADRDGSGTAMLVAVRGFAPLFGGGSARAHRAAGAVELDPDRLRWPDLRTDIDTPADLAAARSLGLGPRTRHALGG
ncbi:2-phospho-L-lactate guanylyltransferase [Gordonia spumicola]